MITDTMITNLNTFVDSDFFWNWATVTYGFGVIMGLAALLRGE